MIDETASATLFQGNNSTVTPYAFTWPYANAQHVYVSTFAPGTGTVTVTAGVAVFTDAQALEIDSRVRIDDEVYDIATRVSDTSYTFKTRPTIAASDFYLPDSPTILDPSDFTLIGQNITTAAAVPVDELVLIFRVTPRIQLIDLPLAGSLPATTIEGGFDYAMLIAQEDETQASALSIINTPGTVTSVAGSGGSTGMSLLGGPITNAGTLTLSGTLNVANGGTGQTTYTDGQLLIGRTSDNGLVKAALTAGTNISITNGAGAITINITGVLTGANGGTGVANTGKTITLGGNLVTSGAFNVTFTLTALTNATIPAGTVTLVDLASAQTIAGKVLATSTLDTCTTVNNAETHQTLTDGATVNWDASGGASAQVTIAGNRTIANPTNLRTGAIYILRVIQGGGGSNTLTWGSAFRWPAGTAPTLTTTVGRVDVMTFQCISGVLYGTSSLNYTP